MVNSIDESNDDNDDEELIRNLVDSVVSGGVVADVDDDGTTVDTGIEPNTAIRTDDTSEQGHRINGDDDDDDTSVSIGYNDEEHKEESAASSVQKYDSDDDSDDDDDDDDNESAYIVIKHKTPRKNRGTTSGDDTGSEGIDQLTALQRKIHFSKLKDSSKKNTIGRGRGDGKGGKYIPDDSSTAMSSLTAPTQFSKQRQSSDGTMSPPCSPLSPRRKTVSRAASRASAGTNPTIAAAAASLKPAGARKLKRVWPPPKPTTSEEGTSTSVRGNNQGSVHNKREQWQQLQNSTKDTTAAAPSAQNSSEPPQTDNKPVHKLPNVPASDVPRVNLISSKIKQFQSLPTASVAVQNANIAASEADTAAASEGETWKDRRQKRLQNKHLLD
eukprot:CAMPEP_0194398538 /NCGR_PEP_ID=MMETSP0174-20130528/126159_1 /TAXON_ID=216777 /ORGANISM="Proboscia alata, Strain PI-D3" /LENGTH=384 /DNA_ID=CAMNT_0039194845 /DNA_START=82 /DNA_END=1233 /DNA_ORIENTATION=+